MMLWALLCISVYAQHPTLMKGTRGSCVAGTEFEITSVDQLINADESISHQLPCIYSAGFAPTQIPLGLAYGEVITVGGGLMLAPFANGTWKGKVITTVECDDGQNKEILWNYLGGPPGNLKFPASLGIGPINVPLYNGESNTNGEHLLIDYAVNFDDYCPSALFQNDPTSSIWLKQLNNGFPIGNILDAAKIVGVTPEGRPIYLGRTMFKDWVTGEYSTILWFVLEFSENGVAARDLDENFNFDGTITVPESFDFQDVNLANFVKSVTGGPKEVAELLISDPQTVKDHLLKIAQVYDIDDPFNAIRSNVKFLYPSNYKKALPDLVAGFGQSIRDSLGIVHV